MKANRKRNSPPLAARVLTIVGAVLAVSSVLDYLILSIPPQLGNNAWVLQTITGLVDRGIVPMVGISFLFAGAWISARANVGSRSTLTSPRFWGLVLASILGVVFLILTPLHINSVRLATDERVKAIEEQAKVAETQLAPQVEQQRQRLAALLKDPKQLDTILANPQLPKPQADQLRKLKANPAALDGEAKQFSDRARQEIAKRKAEAIAQVQTGSTKSSLRTGTSSLILAVGYLTIAWFGLKGRAPVKR